MLCVLDIETVPDIERISHELDPEWTLSPLELCAKAFEMQKAKSGTEFLPLHWHKVISIASVLADAQSHFIKVGNFGRQAGHEDEKYLVSDFLEFFNHREPMLVSFNGRNFDLPVLMLKALAYNLDARAFYAQKDKWNHYRSRYSESFHVDLLDSLSQFSTQTRLSLDGVCAMAGLPGKFGLSGSRVHEIYYNQEGDRLERIDNYCQGDVLNTYWLYLKYILTKGELPKEHYLNILVGFKAKLPQDKPYSALFTQALDREIQTEMSH
ncbi:MULTISPECIES: 3'-5' exonuclease [Helicobacter]|uniref:3'-5' exonuclease n=1 Tax=Helicobacter TaxID=209 RepID=UPI000EADC3D3|nr:MULTISPECIES: 3'-5' exonuclease [Helicobacter]